MAKKFQYGLGGFKNSNSTKNKTLEDKIRNLEAEILSGRVIDIDQTNGVIITQILGQETIELGNLTVNAFPINPSIKTYPLINEIVVLFRSINFKYQDNPYATQYYYHSSLNIWNEVNSNALPLPNENISPSSQNKTYQEIEAGSTSKSSSTTPNIFKPGTYFVEKSNVFPLYPFEGDVIFEGRWGNTIRFGSTNLVTEEVPTIKKDSKTFSTNTEFKTGEYNISNDFNSKLVYLNQQIENYSKGQNSVNITVTLEAGESLVTNPNNLPKGELAKLRIEAVKNALQSYYFLKQNIKESIQIGTTPYIIGTDSPQALKYQKEQYTKISATVEITNTISSTKTTQKLNPWSQGSFNKNNGDPITIIRNGQPATSSSLQFLIEDINNDPSSIWLTSTQKLPITGSSIDYTSYGEFAPTSLDQYSNRPQIVLNSGRLVFNSTLDHILLSSKTSINLNSVYSVNVDTNNFVVQSAKVYLGDSEDSLTQPVVLGDDLVSLLTDILSDLNTLTRTLQNQVGVPVGTPLAPTSLTSQLIADKIPNYKRRVGQLLSNTTRTAI